MTQRVLTGIKPTECPTSAICRMHRPALVLAGCVGVLLSWRATTRSRPCATLPSSVSRPSTSRRTGWPGADPTRSVIWAQHDVPEVTELAWILACITSKGMMDKAHAFKDAVNKGREVNIGLPYPILMAADILAFDSMVPAARTRSSTLRWRATWRSGSTPLW